MYIISKEFNIEMAHRLLKHKGACNNIHGHSYKVIVGLKSESLDENGMVVDFSRLKTLVKEGLLNKLDHALIFNNDDKNLVHAIKKAEPDLKMQTFSFEPTAENLARFLYGHIKQTLTFGDLYPRVEIDFVTIYETETSQATYSED